VARFLERSVKTKQKVAIASRRYCREHTQNTLS